MGDIEQRIIDLLGYIAFPVVFDFNKSCFVETDNYWTIFMKDNEGSLFNVGFVEYDEAFATYHIMINSPSVNLDETRASERLSKDYIFKLRGFWGEGEVRILFKNSKVKYTCCPVLINIKNKDEILQLMVDDYTTIFSSDNKDNYGLSLTYTRDSEENTITEDIDYRNMEYDTYHRYKEYKYQLSFDNDDEVRYQEIKGISTIDNPDDIEVIEEIRTSKGLFSETLYQSKSQIKGTIPSFAKERGRGIEIMNYFREKLHEMLPFNEDIFSEMVNQDVIKEYGLQIFFEEKKEKNK